MQSLISNTGHYTNPEVDNCILNLQNELLDFVKVQAEADAKKNNKLTWQYFKIQVLDFVQANIQKSIDFIRKLLLVVPEIFNSKEMEQVAQRKLNEIDLQVNNDKHALASLIRQRNMIALDPIKTKYGKWFFVTAITVGLADALLAFNNFNSAAYPIILAVFSAVSIGLVISISHLAYNPWIKKARNSKDKTIRIIAVLLIAFIMFAWLGNLRAAAINNNVNIDLSSNEVSAVTPTHINGWAISIVSFALFVGIFSISLILWKDKKERLSEIKYNKLTEEIDAINSNIETLTKQKDSILTTVLAQKSEARKKYDLLKTSITQCKNIGTNAVMTYKQIYIRINPSIPPFFNDPVNFHYDEAIQFFQSSQTNHV